MHPNRDISRLVCEKLQDIFAYEMHRYIIYRHVVVDSVCNSMIYYVLVITLTFTPWLSPIVQLSTPYYHVSSISYFLGVSK